MAARLFRKLKPIAVILLIMGVAWGLQQWTGELEVIRVDGQIVTVIDGDSFKSGDKEFRIYGIDAPEYRQTCTDARGSQWTCGKTSRAALDKRLRNGQFSCEVHAKDQFGRAVVTCRNDKDNADLGSYMVEQGLALSGSHFDEVYYGEEEEGAEKAKRGIWQGKFVRPDIWRKQNPR